MNQPVSLETLSFMQRTPRYPSKPPQQRERERQRDRDTTPTECASKGKSRRTRKGKNRNLVVKTKRKSRTPLVSTNHRQSHPTPSIDRSKASKQERRKGHEQKGLVSGWIMSSTFSTSSSIFLVCQMQYSRMDRCKSMSLKGFVMMPFIPT